VQGIQAAIWCNSLEQILRVYMNMDTENNNSISNRKAKHITVCADENSYMVETTANLFGQLHFLHNPLPELSLEQINPQVDFLGHTLKLPLFISCMTGGSADGHQANRQLAEAAQVCGIPVGMGSIRILFSQPELFPHFHIKPLAPDVPVLANIGMVQLRDINHQTIIEMVKRLEVQALVIHLNPGQELFQPAGDTDFRSLKTALTQFRKSAPFPCIVKETGFGIPPAMLRFFKDIGMDYIDLAGSGGTNWVAVESYRLEPGDFSAAREFDDWGYPTPLLLEMAKGEKNILASGGLRTGMDLAKALALGALLGGMALPFIRAVISQGAAGVIRYVAQVEKSLKAVMLLTGCSTPAALQQAPLLRDAPYSAKLAALQAVCGGLQ